MVSPGPPAFDAVGVTGTSLLMPFPAKEAAVQRKDSRPDFKVCDSHPPLIACQAVKCWDSV